MMSAHPGSHPRHSADPTPSASAQAFPLPGERRGVSYPEVIDLMTHDTNEGQVELVMFEGRPWSGEEPQLFELQEKLNAYLSFALDGELAEAYPQLVGKPLRVVVRCRTAPPAPVVEFLAAVRKQIGLQGIDLEVRYAAGEVESAPGRDAAPRCP